MPNVYTEGNEYLQLSLPLRTEFPVFWEFLGIPRNSQKFPTMQINSDLKSLELLGISGKGRLQFCEDLDPCELNSQFSGNS